LRVVKEKCADIVNFEDYEVFPASDDSDKLVD